MTVDYVSNSLTGQTPFLENWHRGEFLVSESPGTASRDQVILTGAAIIYAGTVLGKATDAPATAPTVTPGAGNTGNGVLTPDVTTPEVSNAQSGTYEVKFDTATKYSVFDPSGRFVGEGVVGTAFNNQIKFNIAAGGTAFVQDDIIAVAVTVGSGLYAPLNLAAVDGTENAVCILYGTTNVTTANAKAAVISRNCEVNLSELIWPAGITTPQQNAAIAQLAASGIVCR